MSNYEASQVSAPNAVYSGNGYGPPSVSYPHLDWTKMDWYNRNYSNIKERYILPDAGKTKGGIGGAAFVIGTFIMGAGSFGMTTYLPGVAFALSIVALFAWSRYKSFRMRKNTFIVISALYPLFAMFSLANNPKTNVAAWMLLAAIFAGLFFLGVWAGGHAREWKHAKTSRGKKNGTLSYILVPGKWVKTGLPGSAPGRFTNRDNPTAQTAEEISAPLLEKLLRIPGTRIIHGLAPVGSMMEPVGHALINGKKIVLVESSMFSGGSYRWGANDVIVGPTEFSRTPRRTKFPATVRSHRDLLGEGAQVRGRILMHSSDRRPISVDNTDPSLFGASVNTKLCTVQEFLEETGNWFAEDNTGLVHRGLINALLNRAQPNRPE